MDNVGYHNDQPFRAHSPPDRKEPGYWVLSTEQPSDVAVIAARAREHLERSGRAIVGVRTLGQAISLLFGNDA